MTTLRQRYRNAFPLLAVVTVVVDALLLRSVDAAPPLTVAFWASVYVGVTFAMLSALCLVWWWLSDAAHADTVGSDVDG